MLNIDMAILFQYCITKCWIKIVILNLYIGQYYSNINCKNSYVVPILDLKILDQYRAVNICPILLSTLDQEYNNSMLSQSSSDVECKTRCVEC